MDEDAPETRELLDRARRGERPAFEELFERHRERLRHTIAWRLDRRVAARVDVSDVLQDACLEAVRRLPSSLHQPDLPFALWLQWIAREKVAALHRRHLGAARRSAGCEVPLLPEGSSVDLIRSLTGRGGPTPSQAAATQELAERLRLALQHLDEEDRELILWRHFDQLPSRDVARLLGTTEAAVRQRTLRALERLRKALATLGVSGPG
jgi:RNA polymerase sigma-70 factor (ECF subfamily)